MPSSAKPSPIPTSTEPEAPELLHYTAFPPLRKIKLGSLLEEKEELRQKRALLDTQIKALDQKILPAMYQSQAKAVLCGHYQVNVIEGTTTTLSKIRLVELGVSTDLIEQATEKKPRAPYVMIVDMDRPRHYSKKED